jgi:cytochrome c551/c552
MTMTRCAKLALTGLFVALSLGSSVVQAQGVTVDANRATRGKLVYERNGCYICHAFGRQLGGPDLMSVTDRRGEDWLKRWLKDTNMMLANDPQAKAMLEQYKMVRMPQFKISDSDIEAVIHFMAQESLRMRKA